jgi:hypothetical protein
MEQLNQSAAHYYHATKQAAQSGKPAFILQYCHAAIAERERERGEKKLYYIGADLVSLLEA